MKPVNIRIQKNILTLMVAFLSTGAMAEVTPLPRDQWPSTLTEAVPQIVKTLSPTQHSIASHTSKDSLFLLQGEWGEDIEQLLGLRNGNTALHAAICGANCTLEQATFMLMEASWEALQQPVQ
jgi:hypothetical protein